MTQISPDSFVLLAVGIGCLLLGFCLARMTVTGQAPKNMPSRAPERKAMKISLPEEHEVDPWTIAQTPLPESGVKSLPTMRGEAHNPRRGEPINDHPM